MLKSRYDKDDYWYSDIICPWEGYSQSCKNQEITSFSCNIHVVTVPLNLIDIWFTLLTKVEVNSGRYLLSWEAARWISTTFSNTWVNNCISIYHKDTKKLVLIISFNILMHCLTFYLHKFVKTVASAVAELKV